MIGERGANRPPKSILQHPIIDKQDKINRQILDVLAILVSNATNYSEQLSNEIDYLAKLILNNGEQK